MRAASMIAFVPVLANACATDGVTPGGEDGIADVGSVGDAGDDATESAGHPSTTSAGDDAGPGPTTASASATTNATDDAADDPSVGETAADDGPPAPEACVGDDTFDGQATWYELATPLVNCSYESAALPTHYGALNTEQYAAAAACGACVRVSGPEGTIDVQIVDQCPVATNPICVHGHIDLSVAAFDAIGAIPDGIIPISWTWVPCDVRGPIQYWFKDGSSEFWAAVQIRNHRNAIAQVEWRDLDGQWHELTRADYNYFIADEGMGPAPYELRVTDVHDHALTDAGIPLEIMSEIPGAAQFPECEPGDE